MTDLLPLQQNPMLRVAVMLSIGIALGDALGGYVPSWIWMIVMAVAVTVLSIWQARGDNPVAQSVALLMAIAIGGAWRMSCSNDGLRVEYADRVETFKAVIAAVPIADTTEKTAEIKGKNSEIKRFSAEIKKKNSEIKENSAEIKEKNSENKENSAEIKEKKAKLSPRLRYEIIVADGRFAGHKVYAYLSASSNREKTNGEKACSQYNRPLSIGDGIIITSRLLPPFYTGKTKINSTDKSYSTGKSYSTDKSNPTTKSDTASSPYSNFDYNRWLRVHGIVARCYVAPCDWHIANVSLHRLSGLQRLSIRLSAFRERLLTKIRATGMSADVYSIVSAMAFGDKRSLSSHQRESYSVAGASHVLALSGMHLSVVYMLLLMLLSRGKRHTYMQTAVLLAVWAYVLMVGMPLSVVRSALMCTVFSITFMFSRIGQSLNTLGLSAVLILMLSPQSLWDVGFQLSFTAVLGILLFSGRISGIISAERLQRHRAMKWCWAMFAVSLSAQILVFPLVLHYFGRFSCYFLLANFVAIPLATAIVYSVVLMCLLLAVPFLGSIAIELVDAEVRLLNFLLEGIASLPGASIDNAYISIPQLFLIYVLIILVERLLVFLFKYKN